MIDPLKALRDMPEYKEEQEFLDNFGKAQFEAGKSAAYQEIVELIREIAEPYEGAKWLNKIDAEKLISRLIPPKNKD